MRVHYQRVSSVLQNTGRQNIDESQYDLLLEDKCSGGIPFFERPSGMKIKELSEKGVITQISVLQIDRWTRCLGDLINTIDFFNSRGICIYFVNQGLRTLEEDGTENPISKMIISILGIVGEMERNQIKERQREGIRIAKLKGSFKGRKSGTQEDVLSFLSKEKNKKAVDYLKKGFKAVEVAKLTGLNVNTITKIKKVIQVDLN